VSAIKNLCTDACASLIILPRQKRLKILVLRTFDTVLRFYL